MPLSFFHLTLTCRWTTDARLPLFIGPALCAGLDRGLKKMLCALRHQACETCPLHAHCGYPVLSGISSPARHPAFVLDIPESGSTGEAKTPWAFSLLVFENALSWLAHMIHSFRLLGENGIGADTKEGFGQFALERIESGTFCIYDEKTGFLDTANLQKEELCIQPAPAFPVTDLWLRLQTPFRPSRPRILYQVLPFYMLMEDVMDRLHFLGQQSGSEMLPPDAPELLSRAKTVYITQSDLFWREKPERVHGLLGSVRYAGDLNEFLPILHLAARLHIGRDIALGMGKMMLDYSDTTVQAVGGKNSSAAGV